MRRAFLLAVVVCATASRPVRAGELTDVASSFDEHNRFDFRFRVSYDHTEKRAQLKRELERPGQDAVEVFKDLTYSSYRDTLALRAEIGLYHDLALSLELPIIIDQASYYAYDQAAGNSCVYPPAPNPNCVNAANSTTIADGIAPNGGFDAQNRGAGLSGPGVFRGPLRGARGGSGADAFDTFNVGLAWAPLSQARDDTKPTWVVRFDAQLAIGTVQKFDRASPDANHGVSEGTHRLIFSTALSRRLRWIEPYWNLWYLLPVARSDSLFVDYGRNEKNKNPQMQAGTTFGAELIPIDRPARGWKLALDLGARVQGHFNGKGYSEAWELLAGAPGLSCDAAQTQYNPACPQPSQSPLGRNPAYPGVTTIENYATLGADIGIQAQLGPYVRVRTGFLYSHDQSHLVTDEDIGTPSTGSGRVTMAGEFNPLYRPLIDQVGRRYRVDNSDTYDFYLYAQVMF